MSLLGVSHSPLVEMSRYKNAIITGTTTAILFAGGAPLFIAGAIAGINLFMWGGAGLMCLGLFLCITTFILTLITATSIVVRQSEILKQHSLRSGKSGAFCSPRPLVKNNDTNLG